MAVSPLFRKFLRLLLICNKWSTVILWHVPAYAGAAFLVAFMLNGAILVELRYKITTMVRNKHIKRDKLRDEVVADTNVLVPRHCVACLIPGVAWL